MKEKIIICDGCKEECQYFIDIPEMNLKCANGLRSNKSHAVTIGFKEYTFTDKQFCSIDCFINWFYNEGSDRKGIDRHYFPGDQVGLKCANSTINSK